MRFFQGRSCFITQDTPDTIRLRASVPIPPPPVPSQTLLRHDDKQIAGSDLSRPSVDLSSPCFFYGMLYVAASRLGSSTGLNIFAPNNSTRNIVFPEALL